MNDNHNIILYGIKNCDSARKARRWCEANNIDFHFHDFRDDGLDKSMIDAWLKHVSWDVLLNKRSTTWKLVDTPLKEQLNETMAIKLMLENPTLIKRPVLIHSGRVVVGFNEFEYAKHLNNN